LVTPSKPDCRRRGANEKGGRKKRVVEESGDWSSWPGGGFGQRGGGTQAPSVRETDVGITRTLGAPPREKKKKFGLKWSLSDKVTLKRRGREEPGLSRVIIAGG